jgi:Polysulphide reductase, NrfD
MLAESAAYSHAPIVTKAPPWHGWVVADLFLSSLAAGIFAVGALAILIRPGVFTPIARIGFVMVFPLMLADLVCLIVDLGDPARFHHMLRVFKPGSPMSVGVWTISLFSFIAFLAFMGAIAGESGASMRIIAAVGLIPALVVGAYKGILLSATAQPGWRRMRWLGGAFSISSAAMGVAVIMAIAFALGSDATFDALFDLLAVALLLNLFVMGRLVAGLTDIETTQVRGRAVLAYRLLQYIGNLLPLLLVNPWASNSVGTWLAAAVVLLAAFGFRYFLVMLPQWEA